MELRRRQRVVLALVQFGGLHCIQKILKGEFRFDYRVKVSKLLSDHREIHVGCTAGIPSASRARDIKQVRKLLGDLT